VKSGDTPESLAERILVEEHLLYPRCYGNLRTVSYFGKRGNDDVTLSREAMSHLWTDEYRLKNAGGKLLASRSTGAAEAVPAAALAQIPPPKLKSMSRASAKLKRSKHDVIALSRRWGNRRRRCALFTFRTDLLGCVGHRVSRSNGGSGRSAIKDLRAAENCRAWPRRTKKH